MSARVKIGIVGVSGYGGSELLRLCASHPTFEIAYVGGESTAGQSLAARFPALAGHPVGKLSIESFAPENISGLDLLFASLPTGKSREPLARISKDVKVVDIGGDHRFVEGWTYGLTEFPGYRERIRALRASPIPAVIRPLHCSPWRPSSRKVWWKRKASSSTAKAE
jgi:N-acetyl-gamma-glutamylphosphate reductase